MFFRRAFHNQVSDAEFTMIGRPLSLLVLIFVALGLSSLSGCGKPTEGAAKVSKNPSSGEEEVEKSEDEEKSVLVRVGPFVRKTVDSVLKVHADLWPVESADVFSEAAGVVREVRKREGDLVEKGELVIQLDDDRLALTARMKKVLWDQAKTRVRQSELSAQELKETVKTKGVLAEKARVEFERMRSLFEGGVDGQSLDGIISREVYDAKRYTHEEARIAHSAAGIQVRRALVDLELARQQQEQARLEYELSEHEQELRQLRSPIDGRLSFLEKKPGELVSSQEKSFSVVSSGKLEAKLFVPQNKLPRLAVGQKVKIKCDVYPGEEFEGEVEVINPVVDREQGMIRALVGVTEKRALELLRPGMFIHGEVVLETRENAVMVSKKAILFESQQSIIYLVEDGRARRYVVETGLADLTDTEVLQLTDVEGKKLQSPSVDALVVVMGHSNLKEGTVVEFEPSGDLTSAEEEAADARSTNYSSANESSH